MASVLVSLVSGLIFGIGLILSGMSDPSKVLGFLDLAGHWDPSLILVMTGAISVGLIVFRRVARRPISFLGKPISLPKATAIDWPLVSGSALFGVGWGLAGICPGPAFVLLGSGVSGSVVFVAALLGGMALFEVCRWIHSALQ